MYNIGSPLQIEGSHMTVKETEGTVVAHDQGSKIGLIAQ